MPQQKWERLIGSLAGGASRILPMYLQLQLQQEAEEEAEMERREAEKERDVAGQQYMDILLGVMDPEVVKQHGLADLSPEMFRAIVPALGAAGVSVFPEPEVEEGFDVSQLQAVLSLMGMGAEMGDIKGLLGEEYATEMRFAEGLPGPPEEPEVDEADRIANMVLALSGIELPKGIDSSEYLEAIQEAEGMMPEPTEPRFVGPGGATVVDPRTAEVLGIVPPIEGPPEGMRTDRHNNPTAMITDFAAMMGGVEGTDYVQGDPFTGADGRTYYTARLLGDGMQTSIRLFDQGAERGQNVFNWWNGISDEAWLAKSDTEKVDYVNSIYQMEGGADVERGFRGIAAAEEEPADLDTEQAMRWWAIQPSWEQRAWGNMLDPEDTLSQERLARWSYELSQDETGTGLTRLQVYQSAREFVELGWDENQMIMDMTADRASPEQIKAILHMVETIRGAEPGRT